MPSYMLLLYDGPSADRKLSPEEMQGIIEKYQAWGNKLESQGKYLAGNKLKDGEGRWLQPGDGKPRVLDGPFSETKEVIGGYFTIKADDYDEAVRLASDCPHLGYGGCIEVREVDLEDH